MLCNENWAISHLQTEMGFFKTSVTACTINKNTFSAPFGILYVRTEIRKEIFQKNSYTTPHFQMGVTVIGFVDAFGQCLQLAFESHFVVKLVWPLARCGIFFVNMSISS